MSTSTTLDSVNATSPRNASSGKAARIGKAFLLSPLRPSTTQSSAASDHERQGMHHYGCGVSGARGALRQRLSVTDMLAHDSDACLDRRRLHEDEGKLCMWTYMTYADRRCAHRPRRDAAWAHVAKKPGRHDFLLPTVRSVALGASRLCSTATTTNSYNGIHNQCVARRNGQLASERHSFGLMQETWSVTTQGVVRAPLSGSPSSK